MHTISRGRLDGLIGLLYVAYWLMARGVTHAALRVLAWQDRARSRRQLANLDEYLLRDIGISRADMAREVGKPFWMS